MHRRLCSILHCSLQTLRNQNFPVPPTLPTHWDTNKSAIRAKGPWKDTIILETHEKGMSATVPTWRQMSKTSRRHSTQSTVPLLRSSTAAHPPCQQELELWRGDCKALTKDDRSHPFTDVTIDPGPYRDCPYLQGFSYVHVCSIYTLMLLAYFLGKSSRNYPYCKGENAKWDGRALIESTTMLLTRPAVPFIYICGKRPDLKKWTI